MYAKANHVYFVDEDRKAAWKSFDFPSWFSTKINQFDYKIFCTYVVPRLFNNTLISCGKYSVRKGWTRLFDVTTRKKNYADIENEKLSGKLPTFLQRSRLFVKMKIYLILFFCCYKSGKEKKYYVITRKLFCCPWIMLWCYHVRKIL